MFELHRDFDNSGYSGIGVVAHGVEFPDGLVVMRWNGVWPTSVVFHTEGIKSVEHLHGHNGDTRIVFLDALTPEEITHKRAVYKDEVERLQLLEIEARIDFVQRQADDLAARDQQVRRDESR